MSLLQEMEKYGLAGCPANEPYIAAAPELLHSLRVLLDQVDYTKGACSPTDMVGACLDARVIDQARAVIAKATGGEA